MQRVNHALMLLLTASLPGCGHMPVRSMLQLSKVDFATTDPRALRAAVQLPSTLSAQKVVLRLAGRINQGPEQVESFQLEKFTDPTLKASDGYSVSSYRLTATDATRLSDFRASLFRQKAVQGGRGELTLTIHPEVCTNSPIASDEVLATSYIKTSETQAYVPLVRDYDLRTINPVRDLIATAPPCEQADRE